MPDGAESIGEDLLSSTAKDVSDEMKREHPEKFEGIDFVGWHEAEAAGLTNEFDNAESMYYEEDSVMLTLEAFYVDTGRERSGEHKCYVSCAINFESPYHRRGAFEWSSNEEFSFVAEKDFDTKLKDAIKKVTSEL